MAIRRLNALVVVVLLTLGVVVQGALPAHGCTCMMPDPFGGLAEADGAFVGTLVEVDRSLSGIADTGQLIDFRFEVEATLKGEIGDAVLVKSAASGASCGIEVPVGGRAGFLLHQVNGEWRGDLCSTLAADALLAAAQGLPEPVEGSPPHLIVLSQMGEAGLVALNRDGQVVGYGQGPQPWIVSACPDNQTFIGTASDTTIKVWSFADLTMIGEHRVNQEATPWIRNLLCIGPGGSPFLAVTMDTSEVGSLVRYADGTPEVLAENIEMLLDTPLGPVAIGGDGRMLSVDESSGSVTELPEPIGDVHGQIVTSLASPSGSHIVISLADWSSSIPDFRVLVVALADGSVAEMGFDCDIYPVWLDDTQISLWDHCTTEVGGIYNSDLELIGEGRPPDYSYGWSVTDETGAIFYPGELEVTVIEPGSETAAEFGQLTGYPSGALLVPEEARSAWTGTAFRPAPVVDAPVTTFVELGPLGVEPGPESDGSPLWLIIVGAVSVGGVIWMLIHRPRDEDLVGVIPQGAE